MSRCAKRRYQTRLDAEMAMLRIQAEGDAVTLKPVRAYRCEFCGMWHLTAHSHRRQPRLK